MSDHTERPALPAYPMSRAPGVHPPAEFAALRRDCPVAPVRLRHGQRAYLLTRDADVRAALADHRSFSSNPSKPGYPQLRPVVDNRAAPGSFLVTDPPQHTRYRRMLATEFTPLRVRAWQQQIERVTHERLSALLSGPKPADLVAGFALPVPSDVICFVLGVPRADQEFFASRSRAHLDRSLPPSQVNTALEDLHDYLAELIRFRCSAPADDLISRVATRYVVPGELTVAEAVGMSVLLLVGGHETTANTIALAVLTLSQHPAQWQALVDDDSLVDNAVEELLRYLSPVHQGVVRAVAAPITLAGSHLRPGDGVIASLAAANRDPAAHHDPDVLDIRRNTGRHLAFGAGTHHCIGHELARIELKVALRALARHAPGLRLAVGASDLQFRFQTPVYGLATLPITW